MHDGELPWSTQIVGGAEEERRFESWLIVEFANLFATNTLNPLSEDGDVINLLNNHRDVVTLFSGVSCRSLKCLILVVYSMA